MSRCDSVPSPRLRSGQPAACAGRRCGGQTSSCPSWSSPWSSGGASPLHSGAAPNQTQDAGQHPAANYSENCLISAALTWPSANRKQAEGESQYIQGGGCNHEMTWNRAQSWKRPSLLIWHFLNHQSSQWRCCHFKTAPWITWWYTYQDVFVLTLTSFTLPTGFHDGSWLQYFCGKLFHCNLKSTCYCLSWPRKNTQRSGKTAMSGGNLFSTDHPRVEERRSSSNRWHAWYIKCLRTR